uniref:Secreted protein n=3 Tax=Bos TaxID=9903 RepID=A0ABI0NJ95_BOVIN
MKYYLYRAKVTQIMCVVALYGPNCNAAQPVCMGSGSWTQDLECHPGRGLLLVMWRWPEGERVTENEMAGLHHQCNGHELGQTSGNGEGQGGLAHCGPWGCRYNWANEQQQFLEIKLFQGE